MDAAISVLGATGAENLYHISFLVRDLEAGMAHYGAIYQTEFAAPGCAHYPGSGDNVWPIRYSYSKTGPPFLEVIEGVDDPGSPFSFAHTGGRPGFHHLGMYAERWRDEVDRLEVAGMEVLLVGKGMAFVKSPMGFLIEVVSWKGREFIHRYMAENGVDLGGD